MADDWTSHDLHNDAALDRTLANIARRAQHLWDDGYTCYPGIKSARYNSFAVVTPKGDIYHVVITDTPTCEVFGDSCTCPAWGKYGECKHHLGVLYYAWEKAQCDRHDAEVEAAETSEGCDPDAEF